MVAVSKQKMVYDLLKERILSGFYPAGSRFPVELEFAKECNVSFITLRAALGRLAEDGLIDRLPGRGTFVRDRKRGIKKVLVVLFHFHEDAGFPLHQDFFNRELIRGLLDQCYTAGLEPVVCGADHVHEYMIRVQNGEFCGVILDRPDSAVALRYLEQLRKMGVPFVVCSREAPAGPQIMMDQAEDMHQLMQTLFRLGHRRIFLADFKAYQSVCQARHRAFLQEMSEVVDDPGKYCVIDENAPPEKTIRERWNQCRGITALIFGIACFDHIRSFLRKTGLQVPKQLSVVQWGEELQKDRNNGPFSVFTEARPEIGSAAVTQIALQLSGKVPIPMTKVHGKLILRDSIAAPYQQPQEMT